MLKVAVIGVGGIARWHVPGWEASQHAELVAGCDINEEVLQKWGDLHGIGKLETDPAEIFRDPDIDIIDICTPNNYHAPLAIAALDAGKHVLCEKPLAPKPAAIRAMIAARDRSGRMLMTAQHHRFSSISVAMKAEIDAGSLGEVYHARSWMLRRAGVPARPGFVIKAHSGGGPCIDIGVHILDLTLWFMGNPSPIAVTGVARAELAHQYGAFGMREMRIPPEFDVEDFAAAFVRFENGTSLILEVSWMLHHKAERTDSQMWLYGTAGGCHWPTGEFYDTDYEAKQHRDRTLEVEEDVLRPHALECMAFAQAVVDGAPSPVPAEQSVQVMTILDGVYRSQEIGGEVRLD